MIEDVNENLPVIEGTVEKVIFHNDENGYSVCSVLTDNGEEVTVVGVMHGITAGELIRVAGKWGNHPTFGKQFEASYYERDLPSTEHDICKYLGSGVIKGMGPALARRIVMTFGEETFQVLEHNPEWLADIPGISAKKAKQFGEAFQQQFGMRTVMMFCSSFVGTALSVKIYKRWGGGAIDVIKKNPYCLCEEIYGISFEKADKIANGMGIEKDNPFRICSGIKYILKAYSNQEGHVFMSEKKLLSIAPEYLSVSLENIIEALETLKKTKEIHIETIDNKRAIFLKYYYDAERYIADKLLLLDKVCAVPENTDILRFIEYVEQEDGILYASMQKKAIIHALNRGVMILTGGPGTGKTTVIKAVIRILDKLGEDYALAAPTGRAAKRMSEATGCEAKTIHRLLEMEYTGEGEPRFQRDEYALLEEKNIIIDEASMIDTSLAYALLKAIKPGARLILIGDSDQLPAVGAGNILTDLINSDCFNKIKLTEIFRQSHESMIITNAHAINAGEFPDIECKTGDFFFLHRTEDSAIASTIADLCQKRLPKKYGEQIIDHLQIITPSRKGGAGTEQLNILLQQVMNPPSPNKKEIKYEGITFREGDKVMQVRNNYDIEWTKEKQEGHGIFNGDIGYITNIDKENECVTINFDDRIAEIEFTGLTELDHAYAITVHKSQGSEYPVVLLPVYYYTPKLLTRNLLYTAVTRAQKMVIMVGRADVLQNMVNNNHHKIRHTGLIHFLYQASEVLK